MAADYRAGVAEQGREIRQLLVCEDGTDPRLFDAGAAEILQTPAGVTGARLREALFRAIDGTPASDAVLFADCDDRMLPGAAETFLSALQTAEVAAADMEITDPAGRPLRRRFFDGADLPDRTEDAGALARRNWMGLTNTAVRREAVDWAALSVPAAVSAVDWWLFATLLYRGLTAACVRTPVTRYRSNPAGTLGYGPARSFEALQRRLSLVADHQTALLGRPTAEIAGLQALALRRAPEMEHALADLPETGVWYEDVFRLAERLETAP
ncbi:MAG: glycosyltransferase family 2 protein [Marivibrio sp.]|uniref:glycosyltransferase family 2 protein n=1 Tax=Marivibrio sp. TaxID=2039719 RepID=UPI0032ED979A